MSEIKNPEQKIDKPLVEQSSKQLRTIEAKEQDIDKDLDKGRSKGKETASPENKVSRESEHWNRCNEICSVAFDKASGPIEKDSRGNDYKALTDQEKQELSGKLKEHINSIPQGERGNYRVPEPEKIKGLSQNADGKTRIVEDWKPNTDGAKEGTRHMETVNTQDANGNPTYIDRIGSNNGNYFSPMKEDGTPYGIRERATGDYVPEKNIQDNDSYHKYEVKQDFTRENFESAIDKTYTDPDVNGDMKDKLDAYYENAQKSKNTKDHDGDPYKFEGEHIDGVKAGEIDRMFGSDDNPDGGGKQYITPFSARELEDMGMIKEVKKEDY